jgi:membrane-associated phospholipid phosphatase
MIAKKLAGILSIILGPQLWLPVLLVLIVTQSGLNRSQIIILLPTLALLQIIVPTGFVLGQLRSNKVTAWDLPKREERYAFLWVSVTSYLISLLAIAIFGNRFLLNLTYVSLLILVVCAVITTYWKISLHASLNAAGSVLVNFLFGWQLPWLYVTIPLVIWARLTLQRHTWAQLVAGALLGGGAVLLSLLYLGYN